MATGGRVLHHLRRYAPDHRNTVVLVGFRAQQTRGRTLVDGARQVAASAESPDGESVL
jgi:metallo-beta-lactamase family protein